MIVVDTSALMAIVLGESDANACIAALESADAMLISAGTVSESLIVGARRQVGGEMERLIEELGMEIVPVTEASAKRAARAYSKWGEGVHAAALNFGDCFAYEVARERDCPLLFVGNDFSQTDIRSAI